MKELKYEWTMLSKIRLNWSWLDEKDKEQCEWAWDYLSKKNRAILLCNSMPSDSRYDHIITSIDLLNDSHIDKVSLLEKMNKAWNQKSQRDKLSSKKSCNFVLDLKVKKKLDEIAKCYDLKINKTIDLLIDNEYKIIKKC